MHFFLPLQTIYAPSWVCCSDLRWCKCASWRRRLTKWHYWRFSGEHCYENGFLNAVVSWFKKKNFFQVPKGFIAHFYDISEAVSPSLTLGFLGTDDHLRELCYHFKVSCMHSQCRLTRVKQTVDFWLYRLQITRDFQEQICSFVADIFNIKKVRYTSLKELAEDVLLIMETRLEMVQTRLSTELLPPA